MQDSGGSHIGSDDAVTCVETYPSTTGVRRDRHNARGSCPTTVQPLLLMLWPGDVD